MVENRLDKFTVEELQQMYAHGDRPFSGFSELKRSDIDDLIRKFYEELQVELSKRHKALLEKVERETPRCECCHQRIEK